MTDKTEMPDEIHVTYYDGYVCWEGHVPEDMKSLQMTKYTRADLIATENDAPPCVSCGKPSDTSTPDDADMCWPCFGQFNATEYDRLKRVIATAAHCVLKGETGISDTIWLPETSGTTLYEHLVSELSCDLVGDVDDDLATLREIMRGENDTH